jgi:hypothetical protein
MKFVSKIVTIMLVAILSGCAKSLTKNEIETIHRVGIINHFPDYFTHMTADVALPGARGLRRVQDIELKNFVGAELKEQLQQKGFSVVEVKNVPFVDARQQFLKHGFSMGKEDKQVSIENVDLIIEIIPREHQGMINSMGYGFHKSAVFGLEGRQFAYTALELNLLVNAENRCGNCNGEVSIEISGMKLDWNDLEEAKQIALLGILKLNIRTTLEAALAEGNL